MECIMPVSLLFCLSAGLAFGDRHSYPRTVLEDRPVGYWRFEEPTVQNKAANLGSRETALDGTYVDVSFTRESATAALGTAAVFDRPTSRWRPST